MVDQPEAFRKASLLSSTWTELSSTPKGILQWVASEFYLQPGLSRDCTGRLPWSKGYCVLPQGRHGDATGLSPGPRMAEHGVLGQQGGPWDALEGTRVPGGQAAVHQAAQMSSLYPTQAPSLAGMNTGESLGTCAHPEKQRAC